MLFEGDGSAGKDRKEGVVGGCIGGRELPAAEDCEEVVSIEDARCMQEEVRARSPAFTDVSEVFEPHSALVMLLC